MKRDRRMGSAKMNSECEKEARLNFDYQSLFPISFLFRLILLYFICLFFIIKRRENWLILSSIFYDISVIIDQMIK